MLGLTTSFTLGPVTLFQDRPLDSDGFPADVPFIEPLLPFTVESFLSSGVATLSGTMVFHSLFP